MCEHGAERAVVEHGRPRVRRVQVEGGVGYPLLEACAAAAARNGDLGRLAADARAAAAAKLPGGSKPWCGCVLVGGTGK